jgi:hypothetical protein
MNYGLTQGFSLGMKVGPYIVASGFMAVGVGFDYGPISIKIGVEGGIDFFNFEMPFAANMLVRPEFTGNDLVVKFYLRSSLVPRLKMLEGYIAVFIKGKIVFIKFNLRKEIVRFDPLIDMSFGNILPIPPLEVNLFSLGEAIKAFK